ncbi:winged helix-turn-helix domain-containing protein [Natronorubrum thiooxidans]|uniref:Helix-turn-helix domain-containing protein n=1 Tax=Natronorubrum thiooxidans TaxID=308853 RepID=A0A1N7HA70_9EURY|nr:helix-turn-helix domain-containing protein [Natronorubrum thiooxidans]SIS21712.1 Helix-turn-helix domain-containing protein [Natronorubrum thiooxidans]
MSPDRYEHDPDSGDFSTQTSSAKILRVLRQLEPVTTTELAEEIGVHRNTARYRLKKLEEQGKVKKEDFGRTFVWQSV